MASRIKVTQSSPGLPLPLSSSENMAPSCCRAPGSVVNLPCPLSEHTKDTRPEPTFLPFLLCCHPTPDQLTQPSLPQML